MSIQETVEIVWHPDDALEQNYRLGSYPYRRARQELDDKGRLDRVIKSTFVFQVIRLKDRSYVWRKGPKKRKGQWCWKKTSSRLTDYLPKIKVKENVSETTQS